MGLFGKKDKEQDSMRKELQEVKEELQEIKKDLFQERDGKLEGLRGSVETVGKQVKRQSEALEDLIEELQEKEDAAAGYEERLQRKRQREDALVLLIADYKKQLDMLEERICQNVPGQHAAEEETAEVSAEKQEAWLRQFRLLKEQLAVKEKLCGIETIGTEGEHVDYHFHEVLRARDAETEDKAGSVVKVHSRGMIYEGKVIEKAQVDAYKSVR